MQFDPVGCNGGKDESPLRHHQSPLMSTRRWRIVDSFHGVHRLYHIQSVSLHFLSVNQECCIVASCIGFYAIKSKRVHKNRLQLMQTASYNFFVHY